MGRDAMTNKSKGETRDKIGGRRMIKIAAKPVRTAGQKDKKCQCK